MVRPSRLSCCCPANLPCGSDVVRLACAAGLGPALMNISNSLNIKNLLAYKGGSGWDDNGMPVCEWSGVGCSPDSNHVLSINLTNYGLAGQSPQYCALGTGGEFVLSAPPVLPALNTSVQCSKLLAGRAWLGCV